MREPRPRSNSKIVSSVTLIVGRSKRPGSITWSLISRTPGV
jgi:hypothetical protein